MTCTTRGPRPGRGRRHHATTSSARAVPRPARRGRAPRGQRGPRQLVRHAAGRGRGGARRRATTSSSRSTSRARAVKERVPDALLVFIVPPSLEALFQRLRSRATESADELELRQRNAAIELARQGDYDHVVVNETGQVERTAAEIDAIIAQEKRPQRRPPDPRSAEDAVPRDARPATARTGPRPARPTAALRRGGDRRPGVAGPRTWTYLGPGALSATSSRARPSSSSGAAAAGARDRARRGAARPPAGEPRPLTARVRADGPLLPPLALALARWIAEHYLAPPALVVRAMLPPGLLERLDLVAESTPVGEARHGPTTGLAAVALACSTRSRRARARPRPPRRRRPARRPAPAPGARGAGRVRPRRGRSAPPAPGPRYERWGDTAEGPARPRRSPPGRARRDGRSARASGRPRRAGRRRPATPTACRRRPSPPATARGARLARPARAGEPRSASGRGARSAPPAPAPAGHARRCRR